MHNILVKLYEGMSSSHAGWCPSYTAQVSINGMMLRFEHERYQRKSDKNPVWVEALDFAHKLADALNQPRNKVKVQLVRNI